MQTGYARKMVLGAILALTLATGVGAGSAASTEAPQVTPAALGPVTGSEEVARRVVSLGYDRRCGREIFRTGKRQSTPFC
jgi:hypothetical protein